MRRALTTSDLRAAKATRDEFLLRPRRPITVVLDGVTQNYNTGAIFRLCDAFLVQELVVCGAKVELHKRKLVQAAQGIQRRVPWSERPHAREVVADAKARGAWVAVAERTTASVRPERVVPVFPAVLVLGGERSGPAFFPHVNGQLLFDIRNDAGVYVNRGLPAYVSQNQNFERIGSKFGIAWIATPSSLPTFALSITETALYGTNGAYRKLSYFDSLLSIYFDPKHYVSLTLEYFNGQDENTYVRNQGYKAGFAGKF
jgi:tRNA(Leu) C34 or U34 (ribose-2'-O)-methylase TrmL